MAKVKRQSYYVEASNEAGTSGHRPEILASSPEEALNIYHQEFGAQFPIITVTLKEAVDLDENQVTKKSQPVNLG